MTRLRTGKTYLPTTAVGDPAEKVFDAYKNATGNGRLRTGNPDSVEGRMFVAFLAVTLRGLFENKLKQAQFKRLTNVPEALALREKIRWITPVNGAPLLLEVPKKSREVAIAMGIEPEAMRPLNTRPARESRSIINGREFQVTIHSHGGAVLEKLHLSAIEKGGNNPVRLAYFAYRFLLKKMKAKNRHLFFWSMLTAFFGGDMAAVFLAFWASINMYSRSPLTNSD